MKAKLLNQAHTDYRDDEIEDHTALYEGGQAFHDRITRFLPKNANEPDDLYKDRKSRASYENLGGPLVDMIGAWLFSKPAEVEGLDEAWIEDVDRHGTAINDWFRAILTDALIARRSWCWVDLPARPAVEPANAADEEAMGLRSPYLVRIPPHAVRNWGEDELGRLTWTMARTEFVRQAGPLDPQQRVTRWTLVDATEIVLWEYVDREGFPLTDDTDVPEVRRIAHKLGAMPVVRMCLPAGLYAMQKLCDPLLALTRTANDHDWTLHIAAHALMTLTTAEGANVRPVVGAGYYLGLTRDADGEDEVGFAEPGGASNAARFERIQDLREAVHRVVQQMAASVGTEGQGQASAASKMADWASLEVMLSAYAAIVRTTIEQVLDIVARVMGVPEPKVSGLAGWQEDDLPEVVAAYAIAAPSVKSPTFRKEMAKRLASAFLPDATPETRTAIDKEIDAADYADPEVYPPAQPPVREPAT